MTTFTRSPRLLKGGLVLLNPVTNIVESIIVLQYNPETLRRSLKARDAGQNASPAQALRLTGAPEETIQLEAEIDAADQLEFPDQNRNTVQYGIFPQLAALETILYPTSSQVQTNLGLAQSGALEIVPMEGPLTLFIWSRNRILPVNITEFSVTEEAFDPALNPLRAKVSLGMRVFSYNDLPATHRGVSLFATYHQQLERLASLNTGGDLNIFGIGGI